MSDILIREWTDEDLLAVRHITWETWLATYAPFIPVADLRSYFDEQYAVEALRDFLSSPSNKGLMALVADLPAAFVRTHWEAKEGRFYVSSLYVLPEHQGHGLGGILMAAAEQQAVRWGADAIWLGVMEQNVRTLQWYRKQGFNFVEEAPFVMGNSTVNHFIGYKKIQTDRQ
jgi:ribosomal protein S18 acetylase RimI-like enzyme